MKSPTFLLLAALVAGTCSANAEDTTPSVGHTLNVTTLGALPDDGNDDTEALRKAAALCRETPGMTLFFPPGTYQLRDEAAVQLEEEVLSGKMGRNSEPTIYVPYYPYSKGLDFTGARDLSVQATGATLMCEGWMEPVSLDGCENIQLKGLTIDYKNKPFSEGIVVAVEKDSFEVLFHDERIRTLQMPFSRMTFWESQNDCMYPTWIYFPEIEKTEGTQIRFKGTIPESLLNAGVNVLHTFHFRPAILVLKSSQVLIEDVTIHSQPGMGIVGFNSRDITMRRLSVVPAAGYIYSTNTDATHFASCSGTIRFDGCSFRGHGDDATNVHGYYQTIFEANGKEARLGVPHRTFTHAQVADLPDAGDEMELVEVQTLKPIRNYTVVSTQHTIPDRVWNVTFSEELPKDYTNYFLMNVSKLPRLEFENSVVNTHMGRAVLVKTRNVVIRNNVFKNSTGTAIHVGAESAWQEGSHAKNVLIADNVITGCGRGIGRQANASGIALIIQAPNVEGTYLHDGIQILNNLISGAPELCGIYIGNSQNVTLQGNKINGCKDAFNIRSSKVTVGNP